MDARDGRIDFFRGLALYMILVDHVPGDLLARFTYHAIGFSDAAEIFVFLSGIACGIAYGKDLAKRGWRSVIRHAVSRSARIYAHYIVSASVVILLALFAYLRWHVAPVTASLDAAVKNPAHCMYELLRMASSPVDSGILVLYIGLTLIVVPCVLAAGRALALPALAASALMWLASSPLHAAAVSWVGGWYLNPFAWQFLFVIGMEIGLRNTGRAEPLPELARSEWLVRTAWGVVALAFGFKLVAFWAQHGGALDSRFVIPVATLREMKRELSPVRLVHFLSVALLIARYVPRTSGLLRLPPARLVIWSGVHSLPLFSLSVLLSNIDGIFISEFAPTLPVRLILDVLSISAMGAVAYLLTRAKLRNSQFASA